MGTGGYVKISRQLLESDMMRDPNTLAVFMYLLLSANYRASDYGGVIIARGEVVTTYPRIALATSLTERQSRTALQKLNRSGRVSVRKYPKYSVVTILNYDKYQNSAVNKSAESQTNDSQSVKQMSPSEEIKKEEIYNYLSSSNYIANSDEKKDSGNSGVMSTLFDEEDEETVESTKLRIFGKFSHVLLSDKQVDALLDMMSLEEFDHYIARLDSFIAQNNATVKSCYKTICKWVAEDRSV